MKNKLKYLVGLMVFSLVLVLGAGNVNAAMGDRTFTVSPKSPVTVDKGKKVEVTTTSSIKNDKDVDVPEPNITISIDSIGNEKVVMSDKNTATTNTQGQAVFIFEALGEIGESTTVTFVDPPTYTTTPDITITIQIKGDIPDRSQAIGEACIDNEDCIDLPTNRLTCGHTKNSFYGWCIGNMSGVLGCSNDKPEVYDGQDLCVAGLTCLVDGQHPDGVCQQDWGGQKAGELGLGGATRDIRDQIRSIINIALGFLGLAGVIIVLYGGVLWMTARGNDEQVTKAKSTIVSGVIGIIIILLAWTIVSYVLKIGEQVGT